MSQSSTPNPLQTLPQKLSHRLYHPYTLHHHNCLSQAPIDAGHEYCPRHCILNHKPKAQRHARKHCHHCLLFQPFADKSVMRQRHHLSALTLGTASILPLAGQPHPLRTMAPPVPAAICPSHRLQVIPRKPWFLTNRLNELGTTLSPLSLT